MKNTNRENSEIKDVFDLLSQLRREKLFVSSEKRCIKILNETIRDKIDRLLQSTWITTKQRLYTLSQGDFTSKHYQKIDAYNNAQFNEAKNVLGFQASVKIGALLHTLRSQPQQLAQWLFLGEQTEDSVVHVTILQTIVTGLYASCIFVDDTKYMMKLLCELAKIQLVKSENPRRILKQGCCSFRNLYFTFHEVLSSAKFFLNAALEMPILNLLSYQEIYLDVDPNKTLMRFRQDDLRTKFTTVTDYRSEVVLKLVELTNNFVISLRDNVFSFPKSMAWIIQQISKIIKKSFGAKIANAIVTELIFTLYICPAIVHPEQYCIIDLHISDIARHNLMQVGQILQILALNKYETPDFKVMDIYNLLDKTIITSFMDDVLTSIKHGNEPEFDDAPEYTRNSVLLDEQELNIFINFLQKIYNDFLQNDNSKIISIFEDQLGTLTLPQSIDHSPKHKSHYPNGLNESPGKKSNFLSLSSRNHSSTPKSDENTSSMIVLKFYWDANGPEPIGLLSEEKVLNMNPVKKMTTDINSGLNESINGNGNYQEDGSIGNTSDNTDLCNLEAISEAASNHSVASSLELENEDQNDNLSDMVSANVSGRGSPNISGRDTPSSQMNENEEREERPIQEVQRPPGIVQPQTQLSRQIRSEIDDKFCKFEIKKLVEGDETISIISETWSTDVLASDNEGLDNNETRIERNALVEQNSNDSPGNVLDISETQSESAWSTDVVASDTERLIDVDNDDAASVAQSDDAHSVAPSDETRSETEENLQTNRRLSNSSFTNNASASSTHYYQEFRKIETKNEKTQNNLDNNANYKNITQNSLAELKITTTYTSNRVTTVSTRDTPGTSGLNNKLESKQTYDEATNEMLLSNCSLNSNSSGSSSSNSFEHKNHDQWEGKQWLNGSGSSLNVTSTPSESTSELSVLSVNNMTTTTNGAITKKSSGLLLNGRNIKPSASTGAIPKSISFDVSADKGDKYIDDDQRNKRGSFLWKFKIGFKNRRGKSFRNHDDYRMESEDYVGKKVPESPIKNHTSEVPEDILAKYRTKPYVENNPGLKENLKTVKVKTINESNNGDNIDINNSFIDIKKKLRLVLSEITSPIPIIVKQENASIKNKLETILRLEIGKARKLKNWSNIARISEAIRLINHLNDSTCTTLIDSMKEDICERTIYMQYLICSKQELLYSESYLDGLNEQINHDKQQCEEYLSIICVREFLIEQENRIIAFCDEFNEVNLSDEKYDYLDNFYEQLYSIMEKSGLWQGIFKHKSSTIKTTLERFIMSKIYMNAFYPNGDGDKDRDFVLYQHIEKLSRIITPDHKDLMINKMYLREFPWIPAQDALKAMGAYKTPRDKIGCIVHCAKCIMDLLGLSQNAGSTTADDFTPVLVYVIIKVNPNDLLSTIQFVNNFYLNQICGEEHYWWTQFCAAVEYIKTMDYSD